MCQADVFDISYYRQHTYYFILYIYYFILYYTTVQSQVQLVSTRAISTCKAIVEEAKQLKDDVRDVAGGVREGMQLTKQDLQDRDSLVLLIRWVFPKIVVPQNGWFIRETLLKWMIWGYPYFWKHPDANCQGKGEIIFIESCWTKFYTKLVFKYWSKGDLLLQDFDSSVAIRLNQEIHICCMSVIYLKKSERDPSCERAATHCNRRTCTHHHTSR